MTRQLATLFVLLLGCGSSCPEPVAAPAPGHAPAPVERPEGRLPRLAGIVLEPRMHRHAEELAALSLVVRAGDFAAVAEAAAAILAEPRLARPSPAAGATLNDELPARFFALQDDLIGAARAVEAAAAAHDRAALDAAYDALSATCSACHALYRTEDR